MKAVNSEPGQAPLKPVAQQLAGCDNGLMSNSDAVSELQKERKANGNNGNLGLEYNPQSKQQNLELLSDSVSMVSKNFTYIQSPNQHHSDRPYSALKVQSKRKDGSGTSKTENIPRSQVGVSSRSTAQTDSLASNSSVAPQSDALPQKPESGKKPDFRIEVERRFNKSITNSVYMFPRSKKLLGDKEENDSSDSSIDEMAQVTVYNLKSQNIHRISHSQNKESSHNRLNQISGNDQQEPPTVLKSIRGEDSPTVSKKTAGMKQVHILNFKTEGDEPSPQKRPETGKIFKTRTIQQNQSRSIGREESMKHLRTEENNPFIVSELQKRQIMSKGCRAVSCREENKNLENKSSLIAGLFLGLQIGQINNNKNLAGSSYKTKIQGINSESNETMNQTQGLVYNFGTSVKTLKRQTEQYTQSKDNSIARGSVAVSDSLIYNPRKKISQHSGSQEQYRKDKKDLFIRQKQLASSVGPNMHQHIMMDYLQGKEKSGLIAGPSIISKPFIKNQSQSRVAIPISPQSKRLQQETATSIQVKRIQSSQRARTSDQRLSKTNSAHLNKFDCPGGISLREGPCSRLQTEGTHHRALLSEGVSSRTLIQGQSVRMLTEGAEPNKSSASKLHCQPGQNASQPGYLGTSGPMIQSLFAQPQMFTQHNIQSKMQDHVSKSVNFKNPHVIVNQLAAPVKITSQIDNNHDRHASYRQGNSLGMPRKNSTSAQADQKHSILRGESSEKSTISQQNEYSIRRKIHSGKMNNNLSKN